MSTKDLDARKMMRSTCAPTLTPGDPTAALARPLQEEESDVKLGRNDPCHCGSGDKYKKCHLDADEAARLQQLVADAAARASAAAESEASGENPAVKKTPDRASPPFARHGKGLSGRPATGARRRSV